MPSINLNIKEKVLNCLKKYNLTDKNHILLVGFSGGIDSACLLDVLCKLSQEYEFKVIAGHLNHNWRGEESKKEELKAKQFCSERNIGFYSETLPENLPHTEEEARNQRYKFFNKIAALTKATEIITGHTLSDQVETVLYRILKGTGIIGLKGIPEVRHQENNPSIYRPLLEITREENIQYCKENNIEPNIDSSNFQEKYLRNRIRLNLLPELYTYNSGIGNAILRLSLISKDTEEIVEEYLQLIKNEIYSETRIISTPKFLKLSKALQKRILFEFFLKNNIEHNYEKIEENLNFIKENSDLKSGNTFSLQKNLWLFVSSSEIRIINHIIADKTSEIIAVNFDGETFFPSLNLTFKIMPWSKELPVKFPKETDTTAYVDLSRVKPPLFLRTRRPGDIIQPFGMKSKTKFKKYLINKGIPEFERDELLLITNDEEILWVVGVGISELLRVNKIPTHEMCVIQNF
jgi:tRNA(Ile)-lysidine synthase